MYQTASEGQSAAASALTPPAPALPGSRRPVLVLVNLGTPATPTAKDVRPFLRQFLSDRRVIEMSPLLWRPVLEGVILRVRPRASAAKYATVWRPGQEGEQAGSPLMHGTLCQAQMLDQSLREAGLDVEVRVAMRYGEPFLGDVLDEVVSQGARQVAVLPLYPQYSASTVASIIDVAAKRLLAYRDQPELRTLRSFPTAPTYIEALATALEAHWAQAGRPDPHRGERLLLSFHSIPQAMQDKGDPYRQECEATAAALAERLDLPAGLMQVTFQSVFGPAQWIGPATIDTVQSLGQAGCPRVDVICPGFMSDCLETLEEIDQLNRETFTDAGGGQFHYVPWGNGSLGAARCLDEQARTLVAGWDHALGAQAAREVLTAVSGAQLGAEG